MGKKVRDMNHHRPLTKILDVLSVCLPLVLHVSFLVILCVPAVFGAVYTFWAIAPLGWNQVLGFFVCSFSQPNATWTLIWTKLAAVGPHWNPLDPLKLPAGTEVRIIGLPSIAAGRGGFQLSEKVGKAVSINGRF